MMHEAWQVLDALVDEVSKSEIVFYQDEEEDQDEWRKEIAGDFRGEFSRNGKMTWKAIIVYDEEIVGEVCVTTRSGSPIGAYALIGRGEDPSGAVLNLLLKWGEMQRKWKKAQEKNG